MGTTCQGRRKRYGRYGFGRTTFGEAKLSGGEDIGVAIPELDVSAVVRRTARSSVSLIAGHRIVTTLLKHSNS